MNRYRIGYFLIILFFTSCGVRDLRTPYVKENRTESAEKRGKELLKETYLAMGYDKLEAIKTYEVNSLFDWKWPWTWMPVNSLPGNKGNLLKFRFAVRTFDGQVDYLEGRKKGNTYGVQSWQSYEIKKDKPLKEVKGKRRKWGLATYHYLVEAPMRIMEAEIIRYAGEKEFEGKKYDLVFATWGKEETHKEHDQYLIYINQETKMTEMMEITINDFFLPLPGNMKDATIRTDRSKTSIGAFLPSQIYIQNGKPKKKSKHIYQFSMYDYEFDSVAESVLYPIPNLEKVGDAKEVK